MADGGAWWNQRRGDRAAASPPNSVNIPLPLGQWNPFTAKGSAGDCKRRLRQLNADWTTYDSTLYDAIYMPTNLSRRNFFEENFSSAFECRDEMVKIIAKQLTGGPAQAIPDMKYSCIRLLQGMSIAPAFMVKYQRRMGDVIAGGMKEARFSQEETNRTIEGIFKAVEESIEKTKAPVGLNIAFTPQVR